MVNPRGMLQIATIQNGNLRYDFELVTDDRTGEPTTVARVVVWRAAPNLQTIDEVLEFDIARADVLKSLLSHRFPPKSEFRSEFLAAHRALRAAAGL